jgi:tetratricopeptide (TPR) repeat protein
MKKRGGGQSNPRVVEAINHAFELDSKGQPELAVELLSALITEFPTEGRVHAYLALFLYRSGRFDEAIEHGRTAVQLLPKLGIASVVLHRALWETGKRIEALDEMKRLLAIRPSPVYSDMIKDWHLGKDVESAIEAAKRAVIEDDRKKGWLT